MTDPLLNLRSKELMGKRIGRLWEEIKRLRAALEFYADPKNAPLDQGVELWPEGEKPFGERARVTLRADSVDQ